MVECLSKALTTVKVSYERYREEDISSKQYSKVLLKLAELTLMAVRKLPG